MPKALSCGFIVFARETGTVLACHPTGRLTLPEMSYDIPKGHIEAGETHIQAALRELKEETGLTLPDNAPVHEIGQVPYQKQKSLFLFSTVLPKGILNPDKLHCNSTFVDSFGNRKEEVDSYILTTNHEVFFKNLQPYVKQEIARVTMPEPVCVIHGTNPETGAAVLMKVRQNGIIPKSYRDTIVRIKDDNIYPNGYSADVELDDRTIVNVDMDDLQAGLVENVVCVDVDGSVAAMPEFPIDQWFEQALSNQSY